MKCLFHGDDCWLNRADAREELERQVKFRVSANTKCLFHGDDCWLDRADPLRKEGFYEELEKKLRRLRKNPPKTKIEKTEAIEDLMGDTKTIRYVADALQKLEDEYAYNWPKLYREVLTTAIVFAEGTEGLIDELEGYMDSVDTKLIIGSTGEHHWRALLPLVEPMSTVRIDVLVSPNFLQKEKIRISFNGEERLFGYTDWRYESMVSAFEKQGRHVKARIIHGEAS